MGADRNQPPALSDAEREIARNLTVAAAYMGLIHAPQLHYTEGANRWDGIHNRRIAALGQYPAWADCSSFATWCLWNGLHVPFGLPDTINGENWSAGFTGTLATHGAEVPRDQARRGDLILYGPAPTYSHVTVMVGRDPNGTPQVISNGSEDGPYLLPYNYRNDYGPFRAYL